MRKIKFRVFSHSTKKFLEAGDRLFNRYTQLYYGLEFFDGNEIFINYFLEHNPDRILGQKIKGAFAINQYTGIKDCNGREIYEGDIVELDKKFAKAQGYSSTISEVVWDEDGALFDTPKIQYALSQYNSKHFTVIGNIYQNPNILEEDLKIKPLNTREIDLANRINRSIKAYLKANSEGIKTYNYKDLGFSLRIHTKTKINVDDDFVLHLLYTQDFCENLIGSVSCNNEEITNMNFKLDGNKNISTPIIKLIDNARKKAYYRFKPYSLPSGRVPLVEPITSMELKYLPYDDYKVLIALKKAFFRYWRFLTNEKYCKSLKDIFPDIKANINFMIYKGKGNEYCLNLYESSINNVVACLKVSFWDLVNLWVEVKSLDSKHETTIPKPVFRLWNSIRYKYTKETE